MATSPTLPGLLTSATRGRGTWWNLAYHRSTFNDQPTHPHPRVTPDGKAIITNSDLTSYANIYKAEIGDFETLPEIE
ncbi:MAG: hypothetical protein ACP5HS_14650 [Anaerolineae bacterium]